MLPNEFFEIDDLPPENFVFRNRPVAMREYEKPICKFVNYINLCYSLTYLKMVLQAKYLP